MKIIIGSILISKYDPTFRWTVTNLYNGGVIARPMGDNKHHSPSRMSNGTIERHYSVENDGLDLILEKV